MLGHWPPAGLAQIEASQTREYLFAEKRVSNPLRREPSGWLKLEGVTRNNLKDLNVDFPLGCFTSVTGISGSGKSSLVSQALLELVGSGLGRVLESDEIRHYVMSGEPMDKAGAYGIQGRAGIFVEHLAGSYTGVMGLPVCETGELLKRFGFRLL